jgi:hypothetical protein
MPLIHHCFAWKATVLGETAWAMSEENVEVVRPIVDSLPKRGDGLIVGVHRLA